MSGARAYPEDAVTRSKLLLVDDSADDSFLLVSALENFPSVQIAGVLDDGIESLYYLNGAGKYGDRERFPFPDVVVLDLQMRPLSGFQVLESITAQAGRP